MRSRALPSRRRPGDKFVDADTAAASIADGATVGLVGGGGGLMEASTVFAAVERRFLASGHPSGLTLVHALGIGDRKAMGLSRFAHEGMVKRVIGGHWVWSPRMQALARDNKLEAHVLPAGVVMQLYREIGAGRPGLVSHVGLGTFVDPRLEGGRMNAAATADLVEVVKVAGEEWLHYKAFPIHVAIIRGTYADADGNVSLVGEAANLDIHAIALAAHNSGGRVIAQVRHAVERGSLPARQVNVPGVLVDDVVVDPDQRTGYDIVVDPGLSGERRCIAPQEPPRPFGVRQAIARRAAEELAEGAVVNYGYGVPDAVASLVAARGHGDRYVQSIEHGAYGGTLLEGSLFGYARNPAAIIDAPSQFDFYSGGGLDIAFLGFGQIDAQGNVNVSKLGGLPVGPGGFIDIAQNARRVVFCGAFDAKGARIATGDGRLGIERHGEVRKFVQHVDQVTFSGRQSLRQGQDIVYVTERAVFRLTAEGVVLAEIAPGVDLERDVLAHMDFVPLMPSPPATMPAAHFRQ
jgi:acyl CoA:acetate/3-ketoacid CoA transferase